MTGGFATVFALVGRCAGRLLALRRAAGKRADAIDAALEPAPDSASAAIATGPLTDVVRQLTDAEVDALRPELPVPSRRLQRKPSPRARRFDSL